MGTCVPGGGCSSGGTPHAAKANSTRRLMPAWPLVRGGIDADASCLDHGKKAERANHCPALPQWRGDGVDRAAAIVTAQPHQAARQAAGGEREQWGDLIALGLSELVTGGSEVDQI